MKKILNLAAVLVACFIFFKLEPIATISSVSLPYRVDTADTPKVAWVDANDSALRVGLNLVIDTVNTYLNNGVIAQIFKTNTNARMTIDADANGTGHKFAITNNGSTDTIASFRDDTSTKIFGRLHVSDSILGVTSRFTGTVRADSFNTNNGNFAFRKGKFLATLGFVVETVQDSISYTIIGNQVSLLIPRMSGTSNSESFSINGVPSVLLSSQTTGYRGFLIVADSTGTIRTGRYELDFGNLRIGIANDVSGGGFQTSGNKLVESQTITYLLK